MKNPYKKYIIKATVLMLQPIYTQIEVQARSRFEARQNAVHGLQKKYKADILITYCEPIY